MLFELSIFRCLVGFSTMPTWSHASETLPIVAAIASISWLFLSCLALLLTLSNFFCNARHANHNTRGGHYSHRQTHVAKLQHLGHHVNDQHDRHGVGDVHTREKLAFVILTRLFRRRSVVDEIVDFPKHRSDVRVVAQQPIGHRLDRMNDRCVFDVEHFANCCNVWRKLDHVHGNLPCDHDFTVATLVDDFVN